MDIRESGENTSQDAAIKAHPDDTSSFNNKTLPVSGTMMRAQQTAILCRGNREQPATPTQIRRI